MGFRSRLPLSDRVGPAHLELAGGDVSGDQTRHLEHEHWRDVVRAGRVNAFDAADAASDVVIPASRVCPRYRLALSVVAHGSSSSRAGEMEDVVGIRNISHLWRRNSTGRFSFHEHAESAARASASEMPAVRRVADVARSAG
jgi:hypothetical protein